MVRILESVPSRGTGRKDYSTSVSRTTTPLTETHSQEIEWITYYGAVNVEAHTAVTIEPTDWEDRNFPRFPGTVFRGRRVVFSCPADIMLNGRVGVYDPETGDIEWYFGRYGYQDVQMVIDVYDIHYPHQLRLQVINYSDATRTVQFYWLGGEEPYE